jgi:ribosomal protein S18 acetylase RimI-like enzyme
MRSAFDEYRGGLAVESSAHAETLDDVLDGMRSGGAVLAFDGDTPIGSARFRVEEDDLYVGRVSVLPAYRRRGVASAMMRFLDRVAAERGRPSIRIQVRDSLPNNVGLYRALGFEVVSIDPHPRGKDRVWTMRKRV